MYVEKYCRLCALKFPETVLRNVDELKSAQQLNSSVLQYLQIDFIDNDRLPVTFCLHCCQTLADLNRFRMIVIDAQKKLENLFYYKNNQHENDKKPSEQELNFNTFSQDIPDNESVRQNEYVNDLDSIDRLINNFKSESGQDYDDVASDQESESLEDKKPENLEILNVFTIKTAERKPEASINIDENILNDALTILKNLRFKCYKCNSWMETEFCLQDHFDTEHDAAIKYICPKCKTLFINVNDLKKHLYGHYLQKVEKKLRITCEICGKKFKSLVALSIHKGIKHLDQGEFCCSDCGRKFLTEENLKKHESFHKNKKHNAEEKSFNCHHCGKECTSIFMLERHLPTHVPKEIRNNFQCDQCDRKFISEINLKNHKVLHKRSKYEKHICDICGNEFKAKATLQHHRLVIHTNERPFKCNICSNTFKTEIRLQYHLKTHSDEKPFDCIECGKKFRNKTQLNGHYAVHTDEYPFKCEFCGKGFKRKPGLHVHLRQHTGERPYSCLECKHDFINSANFRKHLKGKHRLANVSLANFKTQYPFNE